ncbi:MAG: YeeE/YedE family protein [Anaerolineae bacterium]|nr:YeeE/YedE family protein [Anaerolineae bacterium]
MVWTGLIIGLAFGALLQQGRICFNSAFRDVLIFRDNYLMKLAALTLALSIVVFLLFAQFGWIVMNPKPLNIPANIVGGLLFGVGMVLAGGCASGATYRVGEGMTTAWFAALGLGLAASATGSGALSWWKKWFGQFSVTVSNNPTYYVEQSGPTLASVLGLNPWIPGIVLAALFLLYAFGTKTTKRETKLDWRLASVLLALLAGVAFITSIATGRIYGLGITSGWVNVLDAFQSNVPLNWAGMIIIGTVIGGFVAAVLTKEFKLRMPREPITYVQVLGGGMLMGFGASTAGGCNVGHFLTGIPQLAISSLLASVFFILGNWAMAWILFHD